VRDVKIIRAIMIDWLGTSGKLSRFAIPAYLLIEGESRSIDLEFS
jgi:hypothetical protein